MRIAVILSIFTFAASSCNNLNLLSKKKEETPPAKTTADSNVVKSKQTTLSSYLSGLDMTSARKKFERLCELPENSVQVYPQETSGPSTPEMATPMETVSSNIETTPVPVSSGEAIEPPHLTDGPNPNPSRCDEQTVLYEDKDGAISKCEVPEERPVYNEPHYCGEIPTVNLALCEVNDMWEVKNFTAMDAPKVVDGFCIYLTCSFYDDQMNYPDYEVSENGSGSGDAPGVSGGSSADESGGDSQGIGPENYSALETSSNTADSRALLTEDKNSSSDTDSKYVEIDHQKQHGKFRCVQMLPTEERPQISDSISTPPAATSDNPPTPETPPTSMETEDHYLPLPEKCPLIGVPDYCANETVTFECIATFMFGGVVTTESKKETSTCGSYLELRAQMYSDICNRSGFEGNAEELLDNIKCSPIK